MSIALYIIIVLGSYITGFIVGCFLKEKYFLFRNSKLIDIVEGFYQQRVVTKEFYNLFCEKVKTQTPDVLNKELRGHVSDKNKRDKLIADLYNDPNYDNTFINDLELLKHSVPIDRFENVIENYKQLHKKKLRLISKPFLIYFLCELYSIELDICFIYTSF